MDIKRHDYDNRPQVCNSYAGREHISQTEQQKSNEYVQIDCSTLYTNSGKPHIRFIKAIVSGENTIAALFRSVSLICTVAILLFFSYTLFSREESKKSVVPTIPNIDIAKDYVNENGFVFSDSDSRIITNSEITSIIDNYDNTTARLVLHLAVNEIVARHGYDFGESSFGNVIYDSFYCSYPWYKKRVGLRRNDIILNQIEIYNYRNLAEYRNKLNNE